MAYKLTKLTILIAMFLIAAAEDINSKSASNFTTSDAKELMSTRKDRLGFLGGLGGGGAQGLLGGLGGLGGGGGQGLFGALGGLGGGGASGAGQGTGSAPGGTSPALGIQQGLQGIQKIQKFVQRFQDVMKGPFSFRGVSDTMATLTGLLAAVGGGYLTYVSMVALYGSMMDPQNTAYQHAYSSPPHHYVPNQPGDVHGVQAVAAYPNNRRQSSSDGSSNFYFGSIDMGKFFHSLTKFNYPEASFKLLRIKDETCKQRAICEFERFLAKKGVASVILKGVSKKITGMEKYLDAAYRGLANEDCSYAFARCPYTLGQTLLRSVGLN